MATAQVRLLRFLAVAVLHGYGALTPAAPVVNEQQLDSSPELLAIIECVSRMPFYRTLLTPESLDGLLAADGPDYRIQIHNRGVVRGLRSLLEERGRSEIGPLRKHTRCRITIEDDRVDQTGVTYLTDKGTIVVHDRTFYPADKKAWRRFWKQLRWDLPL